MTKDTAHSWQPLEVRVVYLRELGALCVRWCVPMTELNVVTFPAIIMTETF
jgi:hypothetical protein